MPYRTFDKGTVIERRIYFKDKKLKIVHRLDGPAIEYKNGSKEWYKDGVSHREDGPAYEDFYGVWGYFLDGKEYLVISEYWKEVSKRQRFGDFI